MHIFFRFFPWLHLCNRLRNKLMDKYTNVCDTQYCFNTLWKFYFCMTFLPHRRIMSLSFLCHTEGQPTELSLIIYPQHRISISFDFLTVQLAINSRWRAQIRKIQVKIQLHLFTGRVSLGKSINLHLL